MKAVTLKRHSAPGQKDFGKFFERDAFQSQYAAALPLCAASADSTKQSGNRPRGRTRTRALADAATTRAASCDAHERSFCVFAADMCQLLFLNFEQQLDGFGQAFQARGSGSTLSVRARHLGAEGDKPLSIPLNNGCKLAGQWDSASRLFHSLSLTRWVTSGKPTRL